MEWSQLWPFLSLLMVFASFAVGRVSAGKADGAKEGSMLTEIGYIKSGIDDIKHWQRDEEKQRLDIQKRLVALETKMKDIMTYCCDENR